MSSMLSRRRAGLSAHILTATALVALTLTASVSAEPLSFLAPSMLNKSASTDGSASASGGERSLSSSGCSLYGCEAQACGRCFNSGARPGVRCKGTGSQTGYHCPADHNSGQEGDITYACLDWTFGSVALRAAEGSFARETGEDVFLGVGTYGTRDDVQRGLGACYRLTVEGVGKDIIAQSVNTGHDVAGQQFDLQVAAGGAGAFNTCAGAAGSMFSGRQDVWGCVYGGVDDRASCDDLPPYPQDSAAMQDAGDNLVSMCHYSWDNNVRLSGAGRPAGACKYNPTILDVSRVKCPSQLVELTQLQRLDEPSGFQSSPPHRAKGFPNFHKDHECLAQEPGRGVEYCLTRMMDCRKPSGGFKDNVESEVMVPGKKVLQTCTADGYTRIDVTCGCEHCYC